MKRVIALLTVGVLLASTAPASAQNAGEQLLRDILRGNTSRPAPRTPVDLKTVTARTGEFLDAGADALSRGRAVEACKWYLLALAHGGTDFRRYYDGVLPLLTAGEQESCRVAARQWFGPPR